MSASQSGTFNVQEFTDLGAPLVGGRLYTYAYGTTTQKTAYTDHAGTIPHTYTSDGLGGQYIALNSRGELPATLYLSQGSYDLALKTAAGATVWTRRADPVWDITNDLSGSGGSALMGYLPAIAGAVATTVQSKLLESISVLDFGASPSASASANTTAIQSAINNAAGRAIYFPAGTYATNGTITLVSNTHLYAHQDAVITSTLATIPASYSGLFVTSGVISNISFEGMKFSNTAAKGFAAIYSLTAINNIRLDGNECIGCSLLFAFNGASNAVITKNYIHDPVTEGFADNYSRAICISWTSTSYSNVIVSENIIKGSWTHGINIQTGDISIQSDPTVVKAGKLITVSNNVISATYSASTISYGGIWFSQVQDITVKGNTIENYGDVGIDFEACTNVVASGNTLRNNNKNLALYGNNLNVRFTGNVCTNTVVGLTQVWNTYANTYSVDTRNRDIVFSSNTFASVATSATGAEQIILGTAGRITFTGNKLYNCWIVGTYDSLQEAVITDNDMFFDYFSSGTNLQFQINIAQVIKSTDPFYGVAGGLYCTIQRNRIRMNNVNSGVYPIRWRMNDVTTGTISYNYTIIISDNEISQNAPVTAQSISVEFVTTSVLTGYYQSVQIKRNQVPSPILLTVPSVAFMRPTIQIADNTSQTGLPYTESRSTAGALTRYATNILTTAGSGITWTLADGQYVGQQCLIQLGTFGGGTATVTVVNHDLGINQNGTLTAAGQFFLLVWHGTQWSTIKSTGTGL